ncbi:MAG: hypothetical protein M5U28_46080 [Sandaracinaceae bacterium]|nr:hypothetical protein [Sandaracinaceae bacterium]
MRGARVSWAALALSIALAPLSASAQEQDDQLREARARFDVAQAEFERGHFALAADQFQEVYRMLAGHPRQFLVLYNIARCYEESGLHAQSADAFERYLAEGGDRLENAPEVRARLAEQRRRADLTGQRAAPPDGGSGPAPAAPAGDDGSGLVLGSVIAFATAGAGLALTAIFGGLALAEHDALANGCGATTSCTPADIAASDTYALVADVGLAAAGAAAITGVVLLAVGLSSGGGAPSEQSARLLPTGWIDGTSVVLGARLSW